MEGIGRTSRMHKRRGAPSTVVPEPSTTDSADHFRNASRVAAVSSQPRSGDEAIGVVRKMRQLNLQTDRNLTCNTISQDLSC